VTIIFEFNGFIFSALIGAGINVVRIKKQVITIVKDILFLL
jgi:hypothetical protein